MSISEMEERNKRTGDALSHFLTVMKCHKEKVCLLTNIRSHSVGLSCHFK